MRPTPACGFKRTSDPSWHPGLWLHSVTDAKHVHQAGRSSTLACKRRIVIRASRMQLPLNPVRAVSRSDLRVRFCETDLMGIVHHAQYLTYLRRGGSTGRVAEASRIRAGWPEGCTCRWSARPRTLGLARFEDILTIETRLAELRWASLRYTYVVTRGNDVLAEGETRLACVDGSHVLRRLPPEVLAVLAGGEVGFAYRPRERSGSEPRDSIGRAYSLA